MLFIIWMRNMKHFDLTELCCSPQQVLGFEMLSCGLSWIQQMWVHLPLGRPGLRHVPGPRSCSHHPCPGPKKAGHGTAGEIRASQEFEASHRRPAKGTVTVGSRTGHLKNINAKWFLWGFSSLPHKSCIFCPHCGHFRVLLTYLGSKKKLK